METTLSSFGKPKTILNFFLTKKKFSKSKTKDGDWIVSCNFSSIFLGTASERCLDRSVPLDINSKIRMSPPVRQSIPCPNTCKFPCWENAKSNVHYSPDPLVR